VDDFHIYYSLQGRDALQYPQDSTGDGVPDVVKDIASQLQAAQYLYTSLLGLRSPLQQKIYRQARQINIYLLTLPKGHGLAFDRVAAETMGDGTALPCGLKIVLNAALRRRATLRQRMNYFICINTATGFLNRNGTWKVWRAGWKMPSDPRRKESCLHPGGCLREQRFSRL
jgi:hypothetical protein